MEGNFYLDQEPISFDGPPPATPADLANLLEGHLNTQGLGLVSFKIDGQEWVNDLLNAPQPKKEIKAASGNPWLMRTETLPAVLAELSVLCLTQPWDQVQIKLGELDAAIQPLGQLAAKQPENNAKLGQSWQNLVQAASNQQAAQVSNILSDELVPLSKQIREAAQ